VKKLYFLILILFSGYPQPVDWVNITLFTPHGKDDDAPEEISELVKGLTHMTSNLNSGLAERWVERKQHMLPDGMDEQ